MRWLSVIRAYTVYRCTSVSGIWVQMGNIAESIGYDFCMNDEQICDDLRKTKKQTASAKKRQFISNGLLRERK